MSIRLKGDNVALLHGSMKKVLFFNVGKREVYAEVPTRLKELLSGGVSRHVEEGAVHYHIGGAHLIISEV